MKSIILKLLSITGILSILIGGSYFYSKTDFPIYLEKKYWERQAHSELPNPEIIKIFSLGHSKSYADFLWLSMIQYIGNNISGWNFSKHSIHLLDRITSLSPTFSTAYEWALWMLPIPQNSQLEYSDEQKKDWELPISIGLRWISNTCNLEKIKYISEYPLTKIQTLIWNQNIQNACKSGMLPYLLGFYGWQLMNNPEVAEKFYKIAATHDDAPTASQVLAVIASQPKDNPKNISENFAIISLGGYDIPPYKCLQGSNTLISILQKNIITKNDIETISEIEKNLEKIPDWQAIGMQTCETFFERSVKYFYLAFITQESEKYPEITKVDELLPKIWLETIPLTRSQSEMTIIKKNNHWEYISK